MIRARDWSEREMPEAEPQTVDMTPRASRPDGRTALLERARRLEHEASGLRRLAAIMPDELPIEADEALWALAIRG